MTDKGSEAFHNWFLSPMRLPLENPYSGDAPTAFNAGWQAARDHYALKLTEKQAVELLNKVLRNVNETTWIAGRANIGAAQAEVLRAAGARFKEEA
jgi:hypothetical protein